MMLINRGPSFYIQLNTMVLYCVKRKNFVFNPFFFLGIYSCQQRRRHQDIDAQPLHQSTMDIYRAVNFIMHYEKKLMQQFFFFCGKSTCPKVESFLCLSIFKCVKTILIHFGTVSTLISRGFILLGKRRRQRLENFQGNYELTILQFDNEYLFQSTSFKFFVIYNISHSEGLNAENNLFFFFILRKKTTVRHLYIFH